METNALQEGENLGERLQMLTHRQAKLVQKSAVVLLISHRLECLIALTQEEYKRSLEISQHLLLPRMRLRW